MRPLPLSAALVVALALPVRAEEAPPPEPAPAAEAKPSAASSEEPKPAPAEEPKRDPAPEGDPSAPAPTGSSETPAITPPAAVSPPSEPSSAVPPAAAASPEGSAGTTPAPAAGAPPNEAAPAEDAKPVHAAPVTSSEVVEAAPVDAAPAAEPPLVQMAPSAAPKPVEAAPVIVGTEKITSGSRYLNDIGLEFGWNAPSGWGAHYLRHFAGTSWSVGGGVAVAAWGPKVALAIRRQPDTQLGFWQQVSVTLSGGAEGLQEPLPQPDGTVPTGVFKRTPGRTLDFVVGHRWDRDGAYWDAFLGWSVNLQGTFLQDTTKSRIPVDSATAAAFGILAPGGFVWGGSYGWLF